MTRPFLDYVTPLIGEPLPEYARLEKTLRQKVALIKGVKKGTAPAFFEKLL